MYEPPTELNFDGQSMLLLSSWILQWIWHIKTEDFTIIPEEG